MVTAIATGKSKYHFLYWILFICVLLEVLCNTFWITPSDPQSSFARFITTHRSLVSVIYFVAGILTGIIFALPSQVRSEKQARYVWWFVAITISAMMIAGAVTFCLIAKDVFMATPLNYEVADMLPVIKVMNERYLNHESVYAIIPQFWKGTLPVYLPAMWMPYLVTTLLNVDLRWTSVAFLILSTLIILMSAPFRKWNFYSLTALIPLYLLGYHLACIDSHLVAWNEESVVIGYYIFLAFALTTNSTVLKSIALSLCLLSRFSFIGWVPFFFLYVFLFDSRKRAMLMALYTFLFCAVIMFVSQGFQQLSTFLHLHEYYFSAVLDKDNAWKYRPLLDESLGLVKFIGFKSIKVAHTISIALAVLFPFVALWWAYKFRGSSKSNFLIGTLKISLVLFYNFLIIPYLYLFFVSTFLSLFMLFRFSAINGDTDVSPVNIE